ncbi:hypothetical protein SAMN02745148_02770 [Modicisalibacter ilicicola DSM 19980]|uniref:CRISPR-associated protein Cas2 n=1 Tax=Modicisalibacter ilicicola DSM 19980 TaxID=1121942 RepID=A0A1M5C4E8_9GAMM|nr:hypothetical protein [Halomonas ilicicola]SHF49550.1 hypothetical protein SAMN02745148_02770 [Halomonas ilicicola DSM 19980]
MAIFSISYDLQLPQEYAGFYDTLEAYPHRQVMDSCWLIEANADAGEIRDALVPHISGGDALFVSRVSDDWAGAGTHCGEWLNEPKRQYA